MGRRYKPGDLFLCGLCGRDGLVITPTLRVPVHADRIRLQRQCDATGLTLAGELPEHQGADLAALNTYEMFPLDDKGPARKRTL